jgi:Methyltransferase domain
MKTAAKAAVSVGKSTKAAELVTKTAAKPAAKPATQTTTQATTKPTTPSHTKSDAKSKLQGNQANNGNGSNNGNDKYEVRPEQSVELLKALHILTRDGKLNQDSRRKLKQVYHLFNFIEPLLASVLAQHADVSLVDHGAGKSYLGFILYDLFFKLHAPQGRITGVEVRDDLVQRSAQLAQQFGFSGMQFLNLSVADSQSAAQLPRRIDIVTALHACDTATDDAIAFGLEHQAQHMVLVPCCQAEVAATLKVTKSKTLLNNPLAELWRHPIHTREFGSQLTNVLRCLQLEAHGYQVTVTELVGWEHSMKNELIIATRSDNAGTQQARKSSTRLAEVLSQLGLDPMRPRFFTPLTAA